MTWRFSRRPRLTMCFSRMKLVIFARSFPTASSSCPRAGDRRRFVRAPRREPYSRDRPRRGPRVRRARGTTARGAAPRAASCQPGSASVRRRRPRARLPVSSTRPARIGILRRKRLPEAPGPVALPVRQDAPHPLIELPDCRDRRWGECGVPPCSGEPGGMAARIVCSIRSMLPSFSSRATWMKTGSASWRMPRA